MNQIDFGVNTTVVSHVVNTTVVLFNHKAKPRHATVAVT